MPGEGEGEPLPEDEGEVPVEGEGEAFVEGESEVQPEGEDEAPIEGEGEILPEGKGEEEACGCCRQDEKTWTFKEMLERTVGDWLLVGLSMFMLAAVANTRK